MSGELSQRFQVSEDSIRRDLRELAAEGKLQRVHGGALLAVVVVPPSTITTCPGWISAAARQAIACLEAICTSQRFQVSEDSIRRDLRELAAEGKLQRVHGGALPVSAAIAPIESRKNVQMASKQAIPGLCVTTVQARSAGSAAIIAVVVVPPSTITTCRGHGADSCRSVLYGGYRRAPAGGLYHR
jgi:DNA-binding transcriptional MocR family regulator